MIATTSSVRFRSPSPFCMNVHSSLPRRSFLKFSLTATVGITAFSRKLSAAQAAGLPSPLGQGAFRYEQVPGWGVLNEKTPVNNCHGLAQDREGHIILLNDDATNNVIIYDRAGKLVHKWGTQFPGAHGLSLVQENNREVLFITDLKTNRVAKTTLDGVTLDEWLWPADSGKYEKADQYRPSWTLHPGNGEFYVLDGYGRDYILHYGKDGKRQRILGGPEGGIVHWGPHGGMIDRLPSGEDTLLIAMSDQRYLLRLNLEGKKLAQYDLPGGNPRQIRRYGDHYFVAHLADNWPADRSSRGFISILDTSFRVVANIGGTAPDYDDAGRLQPMAHVGNLFQHPHDLLVDREGSLYVAQFASGKTYPIKLVRV